MFSPLSLFANAAETSNALKESISPLFSTMITIAAVVCLLFIVFGGYYYMTSSGNPEKLERAKKTIRNAFIGFVIILGAGALVAIMQNAYTQKAVNPQSVEVVQPKDPEQNGLGQAISQGVQEFIQGVIKSVGEPVIKLIEQFTTATPLMAQNGAVFNLWVVIVAIADVLFLLVIGLIGFRIMSASVVGLEEVDLRSILPQVILAFIFANLSIFAIDAIITLSNAMIHALLLGSSNSVIWNAMVGLITGVATLNIGVLLFIAVAIILAIILLVYYLQRLIVLYVGAVLSPLIVLLWLLPSFRDFAVTAAKTYIVTIFVLFVHIVILMLAVSLFSAFVDGEGHEFMTAILAIATLVTLLKTSQVMNQLTMMSAGSRGMKQLGETFVRGASHIASNVKAGAGAAAVAAGNAGNRAVVAAKTSSVVPNAMSRITAPVRTARTVAANEMMKKASETAPKARGGVIVERRSADASTATRNSLKNSTPKGKKG
jgi:hypothetical protein